MLAATLLALAAAALHAAWNLRAKRSTDRLLALWGLFFVAGVTGAIVVLVTRDLPAAAWGWASVSALVHVPYIALLAMAYEHGDFSVAYPIARGSGAALAGIGGIVLLGDHLGLFGVVALAMVTVGMGLLAVGADHVHVLAALGVGATIGVYTVNDSHASRTFSTNTYAFATFALAAITTSAYCLARGRGTAMVATMRTDWRRHCLSGTMTATAYLLVLIAVRHAPVGYVAALRESSVLVAAFLGWRYLSEGQVHRYSGAAPPDPISGPLAGARGPGMSFAHRTIAATVILAGLVLLVVSAERS